METIVEKNSVAKTPESFALSQNYPNPFNGSTTIDYTVHREDIYDFKIIDAMGKVIRSWRRFHSAGIYHLKWDGVDENGSTAPSGVFLLKVRNVNSVQVVKMTLLQ